MNTVKKELISLTLAGTMILGTSAVAFGQGTGSTGVPTTGSGGTTGSGTGSAASTVSTGGTTAGTTEAETTNDSGTDWGWIGLAGLAGLAPLFMRRKRDDDARGTRVPSNDPRMRRVA